MTSDAAILANDADAKSFQLAGGRSRSLSASSQVLLNQHLPDKRLSGFDPIDPNAEYMISPVEDSPSTGQFPGAIASSSSSTQKKPFVGLKGELPNPDFYYRPPRARRATLDTPGGKSRQSGASGDWGSSPYEDWPDRRSTGFDSGEGPSSGRDTPSPAHIRQNTGGSDTELGMSAGPNAQTDYAVREVDFYYGVRGPALSAQPTRKLKTGPADPMGPVSSASTWLQRLVGGKSKEKGKGFEVVRSARAPPNLTVPNEVPVDQEGQELQTSPPMSYPPYRDSPDGQDASAALHGGIPPAERMSRRMPLDGSWDQEANAVGGAEVESYPTTSSPPVLKPISRTPSLSIPIPGRSLSHQSPDRGLGLAVPRQPTVPRKSSRRTSSRDISNQTSPALTPNPDQTEFGFDSGRPTSVGLVHHAMAHDNVFQSGVGEGSRAEFVEDERIMSIE